MSPSNPLPTEDQLTQQTLQHWQKWLPALAQGLQRNGQLEAAARAAARDTLDLIAQHVQNGAHPREAWEATKNLWCLLPAPDREASDYLPHP